MPMDLICSAKRVISLIINRELQVDLIKKVLLNFSIYANYEAFQFLTRIISFDNFFPLVNLVNLIMWM